MTGALVNASDVELYRVPADGSATRQTLASWSGASTIDGYFLSTAASGSYAILQTTTSAGRRLVDVPVDGSAAAAPIDPTPVNATSGLISSLFWPTTSGDGVLFIGDYVLDNRFDLWLFDHPTSRISADGFDG